MLFQDIPPDTSSYMIAGYVIFTVIMVIYLASLLLRRRNLEQDLATLKTMEAERNAVDRESDPARRPSGAVPAPAAKRPKRKAAPRKITRRR